MSEFTCAVVGLGRIGSSLENDPLREKPCTHAGAISANPDCKLIAGCDIKREARETFLIQWGALNSVEVFGSIDALLNKITPDILSIATPLNTHLSLVRAAARAGVPIIICEKPLAHSLPDARAIARVHSRGKAKIVVNHERRYSRDYQIVKERIQSEHYGRLLSIKATLFFGRTAAHRDVLLHDGTHMIDIINFLTETSCTLKKRYGSMRSATPSAFLYGNAGSVPVSLEVGSRRDHLVFELDLSFEQGRIRVGNGVLSFEKSTSSPYYSDYRSLLPDTTPDIEQTGYFSGMIADAVNCRRDPAHMPVSSAKDSLEVMRFIHSARRWL